jgi:hypothetical protein
MTSLHSKFFNNQHKAKGFFLIEVAQAAVILLVVISAATYLYRAYSSALCECREEYMQELLFDNYSKKIGLHLSTAADLSSILSRVSASTNDTLARVITHDRERGVYIVTISSSSLINKKSLVNKSGNKLVKKAEYVFCDRRGQ